MKLNPVLESNFYRLESKFSGVGILESTFKNPSENTVTRHRIDLLQAISPFLTMFYTATAFSETPILSSRTTTFPGGRQKFFT